jgi:hypothetical protein
VSAYDSLIIKLKTLKAYVERVEPVYIIDADTFAVAKLARPPAPINAFLFQCKEKNVTEAYKYAFLPILKLCVAYGKFDYDFCNYYVDYPFADNGIVELAMHAMGIEYDSIGCAFTRSRVIYRWLLKHREIYKGYKPMEDYMQRIKKKLEQEK